MAEPIVPHIHVACALIEREDGRVLAAQRSKTMDMPLAWEFPGGKMEPGEDPETCLRRELVEELGIALTVRRAMAPVTHRYPGFIVTLHPFVCTIASGKIEVREHRAVAWLDPRQLPALHWLAADLPIVAAYRSGCAGAGEM